MSGQAKLFSGDIYVDRKDASGQSTGFVKIGAGKLEIKPNVEQKELVSKGRDTYGQVLASVSIPKPADFAIEFLEADRQVLAMALMGQDADISVAAGTVTDESVTAHLGRWSFLDHANVSSVVVTDSTGATTYVEGTDYEVDERQGGIRPLPGGSISDGDELLVDYAYGAESGYRIAGMRESIIKMAIRMDGKNLVDGRDCRVVIYEAQVAADEAVDFLSGDFLTTALKGRMITPAGMGEPFVVDMLS